MSKVVLFFLWSSQYLHPRDQKRQEIRDLKEKLATVSAASAQDPKTFGAWLRWFSGGPKHAPDGPDFEFKGMHAQISLNGSS